MASTALTALLAVRPQLQGVTTARAALGLRPHELLHAGPPLRDPRNPPRALASSVVMTCLHEGWARGTAEAEKMLRDGALTLSPAQDRGCVTPLAAIVSPGTPLFDVRDANGGAAMFSPVSTVGGVDTRMGARDAGLLARLQRRDTEVAPALHEAIERRGPVPLWPIAAQGLAKGDDLHSRTAEANAAFVEQLGQRGIRAVAGDIVANPLFFLTLWMAASALILRAAEGGDLPSLVTRAGGNGEQFAISLASRPKQWVGCDAEAPRGTLMAGLPQDTPVSGAIGDSAVIDMLGFGGQRLAFAPEPLGVFERFLPPDHAALAGLLLSSPQPLLADAWPLGLDAARVAAHQTAPLVTLARLAGDGVTGFIGRGVYRPPVALFEAALVGHG
jgi:hypothetical protein